MHSIFTIRTLLLVIHIGAVIMLIGPLIVATTLFPRYATPDGLSVARALHRITIVYGAYSLIVPGAGYLLADRYDLLRTDWVIAALILFTIAFLLLIVIVIPQQERMLNQMLSHANPHPCLTSIRMTSGIVNVIWFVILVLMVAKPT